MIIISPIFRRRYNFIPSFTFCFGSWATPVHSRIHNLHIVDSFHQINFTRPRRSTISRNVTRIQPYTWPETLPWMRKFQTSF
ncbi:hypothetical protein NY2A_b138R [Paramecium bursaria Chlorella virus NY2A]|uniref:Uncharacterized protein b138R n=1 Tax=Paramecium bursaria Chlorella virus NY2A TaxID=46021 RepID=A7IW13_PBCVN|nr:hypothetical protein NY2A_b138R [Paramecium bursaria Chlorella virus NY2A]YP_001498209.1 hypothetical protein AR158_c127R [Paramecium bursaria Chlorella virus AR158]ABT14537.1 hypothetical protein NY2A_b138R [Paramecium bursaria Chlorella virus NY2A]ABU43673.1 hypothetical protein AR158_c127R [Paramecium bursaria Chlorella virus AR158]